MLSLLVVHQAGLFLFCPFIHLVSTSLAFSHFRLPSFPPHLPAVSQEKQTFGPRSSYTVEGLKANTEYSFSLAAISNKGIGAFTNELVQKTSQASTSVFVFDARMLTHTHAAILLFRSSGFAETQDASAVSLPFFHSIANTPLHPSFHLYVGVCLS